MLFFILRRLLSAFLVVLATLLFSFALFVVAPNDPVGSICRRSCTAERQAEIRKNLNVDEPIWKQFTIYVGGFFKDREFRSGGFVQKCEAPCLGFSYVTGQPVRQSLQRAFPVTASIVLGAAVVYLTLGLAMGTASAQWRGSSVDKGLVIGTMAVTSIPYFVFCLLSSLYVFGLLFHMSSGYTAFLDNPAKWFTGLIPAWITLGIFNTVNYMRFGRASMIESMNEDYIRTARAKGITEKKVVLKHGLRATLTPIATLFGLDIAFQLSGAFFTERIFSLSGLGVLALNSFRLFDLPVLMGTVLVGALLLVVLNLITDIVYTFIDPRVRLS